MRGDIKLSSKINGMVKSSHQQKWFVKEIKSMTKKVQESECYRVKLEVEVPCHFF